MNQFESTGEFNSSTHNTAVKTATLRAFQQRYRVRRLLRLSLVFAALISALSLFHATKRPIQLTEMSGNGQAPAAFDDHGLKITAQAPNSSIISDEDLLALFPPGSCWLAEIDGRKQLIFADDALQSNYMN